MIELEMNAAYIITDSGGKLKEVKCIKKPCISMCDGCGLEICGIASEIICICCHG